MMINPVEKNSSAYELSFKKYSFLALQKARLSPISAEFKDIQGRLLKLWCFEEKQFFGIIHHPRGELTVIPSHKLINPLNPKSAIPSLQKIKQLKQFRWDLAYLEETQELYVWPHLSAAGDPEVGKEATVQEKDTSEWKPPQFSEEKSILNHIFRKEEGHFHEDTPQNRACILDAVSNPLNKVGTNSHGVEIYFKPMPDGTQIWANVRKGIIRNGGHNLIPLKWIPDPSLKNGGKLIQEKKSERSKKKEFKNGVKIEQILQEYNTRHQKKPIKARLAMQSQLGGVSHQNGMILNLFDGMQGPGEHLFFFPTSGESFFKEEDVFQIAREVAAGIFVYETNPFFSLGFRKDLKQFPVIHPAYEKTLVGYVISMIDFHMKGFVNGGFFREGFLEQWLQNPIMNEKFFLENTIDFHEYCMQHLREEYFSFHEILSKIEKDVDKTPSFKTFAKTFRLVGKQNSIKTTENLFLIDADFDVLYEILPSPTEEQRTYFQKIEKACQIMCEQIKRIMPRLDLFKPLFEALKLMNFFVYYYSTLQENNKIPHFTRAFSPIGKRICPPFFPPYPNRLYSLAQEMEIQLLPLIKNMSGNQQLLFLRAIKTEQPSREEQVILPLAEALQKNASSHSAPRAFSYWQELAIQLVDTCKRRYSATNQSVLTTLHAFNIKKPIEQLSERDVVSRIDELLLMVREDIEELETMRNLSPERKKELLLLKKDQEELVQQKTNLCKWIRDPIATILGKANALVNFASNSLRVSFEPSKGKITVAGGCSMHINDQIAKTDPIGSSLLEYSASLSNFPYEKIMPISAEVGPSEGILFKLPFGDLSTLHPSIEIGDKRDFAVGYFYTPDPQYQRNNATGSAVDAIVTNDESVFTRVAPFVPDWNCEGRMGVSILHHAAAAKNPFFLEYFLKQKNISFEKKDSLGYTPLHYAAREGSPQSLSLLIAVAPHLINVAADGGSTPLHTAALYNQVACVQLLLQAKADPNLATHSEFTPLLSALYEGYEEVALELLKSDFIDLEYCRIDNARAIHYAVLMQLEKALKKLLEKGVQMDIPIKGNHYRPLQLAAEKGWLRGVQLLIQCKPYVNADGKTADGKTALQLSIENNHREVAKLLEMEAGQCSSSRLTTCEVI